MLNLHIIQNKSPLYQLVDENNRHPRVRVRVTVADPEGGFRGFNPPFRGFFCFVLLVSI